MSTGTYTVKDLDRWIEHLEAARSKVLNDARDLHVGKVVEEMRAAREAGQGRQGDGR